MWSAFDAIIVLSGYNTFVHSSTASLYHIYTEPTLPLDGKLSLLSQS
jgi:hypothetical protein